ncbi:MAG TPA: hypothetical protein DCY41_00860, partial [Opitutae bacterium]|nr:hypothetical protein [Opitutae bacterium]
MDILAGARTLGLTPLAMRNPTINIFPRPREQALRGGSLAIPPARAGREWLERLPTTIATAEAALTTSNGGPWKIACDTGLHPESYRLEITENGVCL